ncbi:hypothetical protein R8Z57_03505 [Microbacterium sp. M3]|uniref:Uncharacterized protein n=1 Tax=Microbacterium arthrosphaerae TaxID=792652 RepID=A0ABU4GXQ1_9MICO|nr:MULTISPECIES: hypothetical protein [Microbacterium]MDW4571839.1 hypothetical protein [Microbacterium arthrosphaerae]MDW7605694.1 hypothetical protein [Microbacterium sp. M3]
MTAIDQPSAVTAAARREPVREARTDAVTPAPAPAAGATVASAARPGQRRGLVFWIVRYLPAEIAGTAVMVLGGLLATMWTDVAPVIALVALLGEIVGFYAVLAVANFVEQSRVARTRTRAAARTGVLLVAEFGAAEVLDTFLIRPAALMLGLWLVPDPLWGMLAGKVAADVVFYAIAAGAFTVTAKSGLRDRRRSADAPEVAS